MKKLKLSRDETVRNIISGKDDRMLFIIGPCSADNEDFIHVILSRTEPQLHSITCIRLKRNPVHAGFVRVKRFLVNLTHALPLSALLPYLNIL